MPHADSDMSQPMTNGDKPHFKSLEHITNYHFVADGISIFKANPYGQKSLDLAHNGVETFVAPFYDYLKGPLSYITPYAYTADSYADTGLSKVDERFPILKEDTQKIKSTVLDYAFFPLAVAGQGKEYVVGTYKDEYSKVGGKGVVTTVKAVISTEFKLTSDVVQFLMDYLGPKKEAAKSKANEKMNG
ncbi:putative pathogenesis associated protein Cap20 [Aulographum hederae CBS 113979]|uniref:Putative pathogenesis associated protein Cap20 n=1 Tax=Aulographum hederae CBS 113979 TaxID=1176131 RepID=A0A6G1GU44_9PEZI|nr:putative pathogenesis associated protein Cap20 [Aulographum hederae CBS 113979]